jgi:hypothetical protein
MRSAHCRSSVARYGVLLLPTIAAAAMVLHAPHPGQHPTQILQIISCEVFTKP